MTPLQAIEAATANGPLTLGSQAPKSGQLREGYEADFIGLDADPLREIRDVERAGPCEPCVETGDGVGRVLDGPVSCLGT